MGPLQPSITQAFRRRFACVRTDGNTCFAEVSQILRVCRTGGYARFADVSRGFTDVLRVFRKVHSMRYARFTNVSQVFRGQYTLCICVTYRPSMGISRPSKTLFSYRMAAFWPIGSTLPWFCRACSHSTCSLGGRCDIKSNICARRGDSGHLTSPLKQSKWCRRFCRQALAPPVCRRRTLMYGPRDAQAHVGAPHLDRATRAAARRRLHRHVPPPPATSLARARAAHGLRAAPATMHALVVGSAPATARCAIDDVWPQHRAARSTTSTSTAAIGRASRRIGRCGGKRCALGTRRAGSARRRHHLWRFVRRQAGKRVVRRSTPTATSTRRSARSACPSHGSSPHARMQHK